MAGGLSGAVVSIGGCISWSLVDISAVITEAEDVELVAVRV